MSLERLYRVNRKNIVQMRCKDTKEIAFSFSKEKIERAKKGMCRIHGDIYLVNQQTVSIWQQDTEEEIVNPKDSELWMMNCENIVPFHN